MSFSVWLIFQAWRDDYVGFFARFVKDDGNWPGETNDLDELFDYLHSIGHENDDVEAGLLEAYIEYDEDIRRPMSFAPPDQ